ncbi:sporulation related protein [Psychrobacillus insolitus]|uniref:N-acetylmuramoyl-L-alanine amidase n=1 Tax=Psychrobacillus insolitus TaxID=1461 RepID=A0A2W7MLZ9_9BACI|nr:N-acetylmuramoyl-L-alanine amidase [Psychrobacillus insolitus]PZX07885.1 sporulation related protein [Psychrobacillus insolitus]
MTYAVINDYIEKSKYPIKAKYEMTPTSITIHNTWNDASAVAEVEYMQRNGNAVSFHVAIDDKHAIVAVPFSRNCWHAGDGSSLTSGNRTSIGIEICYSKSAGDKYRKAEANAIEYTAQLLKKYGWGIDRVRFHKEWSGKNCPHRILDEGRGDSFKKSIANRLVELNKKLVTQVSKPVATKTATQTKGTYRIKTGTFKNASALADAVNKIKTDFGFVIHEAADTTSFNSDYRIYTGTFTTKEAAENARAKITAKYGWLTYLIDETK